MQAVVIAGPKKSGKTALLALIAEVLERRGKRVAVVKYSSHALEMGNADAVWLMRPNRTVINIAPEETAILRSEQMPFEAVVRQLDGDVLLLEGGDAPAIVPRIVCLSDDEEEARAFMREAEPLTIIAAYGVAVSESIPNFPEIDPEAAEKLADIVLARGVTL